MKEIKAIIQPFMLEHVLDALRGIENLPGLTMSRVLGWGKTQAVDAKHKVHESGHAFAEKVKLEIVVSDDLADEVVEAIVHSARTGKPGDGKVFLYEIQSARKIRKNEPLEG